MAIPLVLHGHENEARTFGKYLTVGIQSTSDWNEDKECTNYGRSSTSRRSISCNEHHDKERTKINKCKPLIQKRAMQEDLRIEHDE